MKVCKNCFGNTKKEVGDFFDYLDCDNDHRVSSEEIHKGI
jgi:hypothetical protein